LSEPKKASDLIVEAARLNDVDGILEVQEANQTVNGGSLSARLSRDWFEKAVGSQSVIVARIDGRLAGYVAFTSRDAQSHIPIVQAMLEVYPNPGAYLHGPICVAQECRGRGVASAMFRAQRVHMGYSAVMSFIRGDNRASRQAHLGMGFSEVAEFVHDGINYVVVTA
jgi:predicted GNAT superfamily acetyltransferase